jgi:hypothetical protein
VTLVDLASEFYLDHTVIVSIKPTFHPLLLPLTSHLNNSVSIIAHLRQYGRPILINSVTGLINTLINMYTAQEGTWSVLATVTTTVIDSTTIITVILFLVYYIELLGKIWHEHKV